MSDLPTLSDLLAPTCFAEVGRQIGKPRGFVFRLRHGGPVRDLSIIPALARALHRDEAFIRNVIDRDNRRILESRERSA